MQYIFKYILEHYSKASLRLLCPLKHWSIMRINLCLAANLRIQVVKMCYKNFRS